MVSEASQLSERGVNPTTLMQSYFGKVDFVLSPDTFLTLKGTREPGLLDMVFYELMAETSKEHKHAVAQETYHHYTELDVK